MYDTEYDRKFCGDMKIVCPVEIVSQPTTNDFTDFNRCLKVSQHLKIVSWIAALLFLTTVVEFYMLVTR